MKKIATVILITCILFTLAACGSDDLAGQQAPAAASSQPQPEETPEMMQEEPVSETELPKPSAQLEQTADGESILIAYFSRTGNTEQIANMIHGEIGGDLFKIETAVPYAEDYDEVLEQARQEKEEDARPELSSRVENMEGYDTIFIGYPIWHGDTPMAVLSFLEEYDFSGKTVIPFCTSGSSGPQQSFARIAAMVETANVLDGFHSTGAELGSAEQNVTDWLDSLSMADADEAATTRLNIQIGNSSFTATMHDNDSTKAFLSLLPMTVEMEDLNGNEKFYNLSEALPTDARQVGTINVGDLMLYGDDCIVLFYETFDTSYDYTPMGTVADTSGLTDVVGAGSVEVTFSLE